ncbi:rSAM/selenodomain-associated transferase 2 [Desulfobaculum xiamenense]|uniref:RSAM/selenodomain-associated transferase 2 n=1 Tax=Desulfobaculum xiamenense TaxID=995050 RepID=A0A846QHD1_9BACT|nr:TIGR04283 family arsenosugar biosynthesis glycosyltransferase [Desulfobaculum xiamenense]NJB68236.1 rSAM/selenodomain-associated transferase 2 [Desulfobaculum xiamenense]
MHEESAWAPEHPAVSIIIPVLREAEGANALVEHVLALSPAGTAEILMVDGSENGDTIKALRHKEIKTLLAPRGRARQMNAAAQAASGDILLFLHADTRLPQDALSLVTQAATDGCVGGAFTLRFDTDSPGMRLIAAVANLRSQLTRAPYGDQAQFFLRDYFLAIGGFRDMPLMEDLEIMTRIRRRADRIRILDAAVTTSARRWREEGLLRCTLRNWALRLAYHAGISAHRLAAFYSFGRTTTEKRP